MSVDKEIAINNYEFAEKRLIRLEYETAVLRYYQHKLIDIQDKIAEARYQIKDINKHIKKGSSELFEAEKLLTEDEKNEIKLHLADYRELMKIELYTVK